MDVLSSGPAGPHRSRPALVLRWAGQRLGLLRPEGDPIRRRWLGLVLAVLVTAGAIAALRAGAEQAEAPVAGESAAALPTPPFDRLPGRVPIPPPTHAGWFVHGTLPAVGPPGRASAERSAQLVLGRFCARPERYTLTLAPEQDWRGVDVLAFGLDRSGDPPAVRLRLSWTGSSYEWTGAAVQLSAC